MSRLDELDALYARLGDLCHVAERGEMAIGSFLSPRELYFASKHLRHLGIHAWAYGGYDTAERCRLYFLPEYMETASSAEELEAYGYSAEISTLEIRGSGYRKLTHRDFLGALLGLGLERSVVGDICLIDEDGTRAYVWLDRSMEAFVCGELTKVANDTVKVKRIELPSDFAPIRRMAPLHDTVASPRLDAVVASLCSLSREQARVTVQSGLVELNYETEERGDCMVCAPALISVRGIGKFRVLAVSDLTKKGRIRLEAEKYL